MPDPGEKAGGPPDWLLQYAADHPGPDADAAPAKAAEPAAAAPTKPAAPSRGRGPVVPIELPKRERAAAAPEEPAEYKPPPNPRQAFGPGLVRSAFPAYHYDTKQKEGESDSDYTAREDKERSAAFAEAKARGEPLKRHDKTTGIEHMIGAIMPVLQQFGAGVLGTQNFGLGRSAVEEINPDLKKLHNIDLPGMGAADWLGSAAGLLNGRSVERGLLDKVANRAAPGKGLLPGMVGAAAAGTADEAVRTGIDYTKDKTAGRPTQSPQDMLFRVLGGGEGAAFLAPLLHGAQAGAGALVKGLRAAPGFGSKLGNLERAGGGTSVLGGVRPSPAMREAQDLQSRPGRTEAEIDQDPSLAEHGREAQDISAERARSKLQGSVQRYDDAAQRDIGDVKKGYAQSPAGQTQVSVEPVIKALQERVASKTGADGHPLPAYELEADHRLLGQLQTGVFQEPGVGNPDADLTVPEARKRGVPFNEQDISSRAKDNVDTKVVMENPRLGTFASGGETFTGVSSGPGTNQKPIALLRGEGQQFNEGRLQDNEQKALEKSGSVKVAPRTMNAQQLETTIKEYRDTIKNKRSNSEKAGGEAVMLKALMDLREQFPADATYAPAATGGWKGTMGRAEQRMSDLETVLGHLGLDPQLDKIKLDDPRQQQALKTFVQQYRAKGGAAHDADALTKFIADNPEAAAALETYAGHRDYDALKTAGGGLRLGMNKSGPRAWVGDLAEFGRLHGDPILQKIGGVNRTQKGGLAGQLSPVSDASVAPTTNAARRAAALAPLDMNDRRKRDDKHK